MGKDVFGATLAPWNATMENGMLTVEHFARTKHPFIFTEYMAFGLSPVYLAVLLALPLLCRRLPRPFVYWLLFGVGVGAVWFFQMQQTRYLIPALPGFALVAAHLIAGGGKSLRVTGDALVGIAAIWALYLACAGNVTISQPRPVGEGIQVQPVTQNVAWVPRALPVLLGTQTPRAYAESDPVMGNLIKAELWINENTPKDAKVAILDEVRGFYLDRPYVWAQPDHAHHLIPWDDYVTADEWLADFQRRGYTTILHHNQGVADEKKWRFLLQEAVSTGKLAPAYSAGRVTVYRLP
jgi:hypothetical protein